MNHDILKRVIYDQHEVIRNTIIVNRDIFLETNGNYVIVGPRRAGKSTILYKRVQDLIASGVSWNQIIYINFDDERLVGFSSSDFEDIITVSQEMSGEKHYYFFDEIQNIDNWELFAIRVANQGLKVDITGSNAKMLSKDIEKTLGGRYLTKEVYPYSFKEYLRAIKVKSNPISTKEIAEFNNALEQYFVNGGFPESINFTNKREYLSNIYLKVLYGDIVVRNSIRNENGLKLLISKIAETVKTDVSYTRLTNAVTGIGYKISKDIIINYCGYCEDAFLLFSLENYYSAFVDKKSKLKFYFIDNGILNLFLDDKKSSLIENIVAIQLHKQFKDKLYYVKNDKAEIDFYIPEEKNAIQVAYRLDDSDSDREIESLMNFAKASKEKLKLTLITFDEDKIIEKNGYQINVISLKNFLS